MTQADLANRIDVSVTAISNWENGNDLSIDRVFELAPHLEREPSELLQGLQERSENGTITQYRQLRGRVVPRLDFHQVKDREQVKRYLDEVRSAFPCSIRSFALTINDRANAPDYLPGDSVIIDPEIAPEPDDMVFAFVGPEQLPVFRKLTIAESVPDLKYVLRPRNESWPSYQLQNDEIGAIVGVMSEHTRPRRQWPHN